MVACYRTRETLLRRLARNTSCRIDAICSASSGSFAPACPQRLASLGSGWIGAVPTALAGTAAPVGSCPPATFGSPLAGPGGAATGAGGVSIAEGEGGSTLTGERPDIAFASLAFDSATPGETGVAGISVGCTSGEDGIEGETALDGSGCVDSASFKLGTGMAPACVKNDRSSDGEEITPSGRGGTAGVMGECAAKGTSTSTTAGSSTGAAPSVGASAAAASSDGVACTRHLKYTEIQRGEAVGVFPEIQRVRRRAPRLKARLGCS